MQIPRLAEIRQAIDWFFGDPFTSSIFDDIAAAGITDADIPESIPDEALNEFDAREAEGENLSVLTGEFLNRYAPAVAAKLGLDAA